MRFFASSIPGLCPAGTHQSRKRPITWSTRMPPAARRPARTVRIRVASSLEAMLTVQAPGLRAQRYSVGRRARRLTVKIKRGRATLRRVMLLLDARIELKDADGAVMELLDRAAVTFQLVLTKVDEVRPGALNGKLEAAGALAREHPAAHPHVAVTSSKTGEGIEALRAEIATLTGR